MNHLIFAFCLVFSMKAFSWGQIGHRVVGEIAQRHLNKKVSKKLKKIMKGKSLADATTWADETRSNPNYRELVKSHYTSIKDAGKYGAERADDIIRMIEKLAKNLKEKKNLNGYKNPILNNLSQKDQLSLIAHFIGDLHQPLHVGRASDWGGNRIRVKWFDKESNLHKVWDEEVIEHMKLSFSEIVSFIDYPENINSTWIQGTPKELVLKAMQESFNLRATVYEFRDKYIEKPVMMSEQEIFKKYPASLGNKKSKGSPVSLKWNYNYRAVPVVKKRLLQAGLRLAAILNTIYQ